MWITSSQFSLWVVAVPLPAGMLTAELNWTEKGTNQFLKWFRSLHSLKRFAHSNDTYATDTTLQRMCFESSETKTALNECYWQEHIGSLKWHIHMQSGLWYANIIRDRKHTKHANKYRKYFFFISAPLQLFHATLMSFLIVDKNKWPSKINQLRTM